VGFCDQAHLTRAFKARIGVTPGAYRKAVAA
jgi:AraC-like DNA-binding protein